MSCGVNKHNDRPTANHFSELQRLCAMLSPAASGRLFRIVRLAINNIKNNIYIIIDAVLMMFLSMEINNNRESTTPRGNHAKNPWHKDFGSFYSMREHFDE